MEINFIEEVAKALDVLSVERLVRTSEPGAVHCRPCKKRLYTYTQARFVILRMRMNEEMYMEEYLCAEQEGDLYHVTNMDKQLDKAKSRFPWEVKRIERGKARLDGLAMRSFGVVSQNLVIVDGRAGGSAYPKALRRKIIRALVFPVQGVRKPRKRLIRKGRKPRKRTPRRDTARRGYPRGETMTKMLSWANSHKFHVDSEHRSCRPRGNGAEFRRRNRAREVEAVRREVEREVELTCIEPGCHPRWHDRTWDMNDEYTAPSNEVWRALAENDDGLRFVDFDGTYTTGVV